MALFAGGAISLASFAMFQLIPRQIIALFGEGSAEYYEFGEKYFRIFMFFTCLNFLQPITTTFFTSIGKAIKGVILSMTRQIIFLLPLLVLLPMAIGIDGILYAGPIADLLAAVAAVLLVAFEMRNMKRLELQKS